MTPAAPYGPVPTGPRRVPGDRQVIAALVGVQAAISLGFFAAMAHVVVHLKHDLGLLAGTIGLVLGVRIVVQYTLFLPVGALSDLLGAARTGVLACALRACGFVLLGTAGGLPGLIGAAVLLGVGGAMFHPAAQSLLAGVAPARRSRGFAAYAITQQAGAVAGPPLGLLLLSSDGGYGLVAAVAAGAWTLAAFLFLLLWRVPRARVQAGGPSPLRGIADGVRAVVRDRPFVRFALVAAPTTLLADQTMTVVPLTGVGANATTVFSCVMATAAASMQPWCATRGRAERPAVLRAGMLFASSGYLLLGLGLGDHLPGLVAAAVLHGIGNGLMLPAVFQTIARYAPAERIGAYLGVPAFLAGLAAFGGGLAVGRLFDFGDTGAAAALIGLALVGLVCAQFARRKDEAIGAAAPAPVPPPSTMTEKARSPR